MTVGLDGSNEEAEREAEKAEEEDGDGLDDEDAANGIGDFSDWLNEALWFWEASLALGASLSDG